MSPLYLATLQSKYFKWPATAISIICFSIVVHFSTIKDVIIFPNADNYNVDYYTDVANGGNSVFLEYAVSDTCIKACFLLKPAFHSPYIGLSITPSNNKWLNAQKYNQIDIELLGKNIDRVGLGFYTLPYISDENGNQIETLYHSYLNISEQKKCYSVDLSQFQHPEWWEDVHHISNAEKITADLSRILHINIGSAYSSDNKGEKILEINSFTFTRNNKALFLFLGFGFVVFLLLSFAVVYFVLSDKKKSAPITVAYKPLIVAENKYSDHSCIEYINTHFQNSELNLQLVADETGVPQRRITSLINEEFKCNFKTYINRIRINEAKRLLNKSYLNIGEIAYEVGFNNQSHFNRVFKAEVNISPSEYIENQG